MESDLSFKNRRSTSTYYIGELQDGNTKLTPPQKLTLSEGFNFPGHGRRTARPLSSLRSQWPLGDLQARVESGLCRDPCDLGPRSAGGRTSPDGKWILYFSSPVDNANSPSSSSPTPLRLMRIPVTGGPPELVLTARMYNSAWCARSPSTLCAFAEQTPDRKELVFTAFDPIRGKGHELARFATDPNADYGGWSLSPDGTRIGDSSRSEGITYTCFRWTDPRCVT